MKELIPCKRCHEIPKIVDCGDLFYVQCTGEYKKRINYKNLSKEDKETKNYRMVTTKCDKWMPYEFLGTSRRAAIESWNYANSRKSLDEED